MTQKHQFKIRGEYVELIQLLKALNLVESGGMAKHVVEAGMVQRNGAIETRKRAKLKPGDQIRFEDHFITLE